MSAKPWRIGIVAGEPSGDHLGASLMRAFKRQYPEALFVGIGGPNMKAAGLQSLYPLETLSVMGFIAPLLRLPSLLNCFYGLLHHFLNPRIDCFIGIDSPDFNLRLAARLKKRQIKTLHWVSPSVWAWRSGRIHGIKKAIDLMLVLFPFEEHIYRDHQIPVRLTGHPLADHIPEQITKAMKEEACLTLGLDPKKPILGLLPGSRHSEIHYLGAIFIETARRLQKKIPNLQILAPMANEARKKQVEKLIQAQSGVPLKIQLISAQDNHKLMMASTAVLLASGTVTLEALLCKAPMVVAYKMSALSYEIAKRVIRVPYISLPNLLTGQKIVEEYIQSEATPEHLFQALWPYFQDGELASSARWKRINQYEEVHHRLKKSAGERASEALSALLKGASCDKLS